MHMSRPVFFGIWWRGPTIQSQNPGQWAHTKIIWRGRILTVSITYSPMHLNPNRVIRRWHLTHYDQKPEWLPRTHEMTIRQWILTMVAAAGDQQGHKRNGSDRNGRKQIYTKGFKMRPWSICWSQANSPRHFHDKTSTSGGNIPTENLLCLKHSDLSVLKWSLRRLSQTWTIAKILTQYWIP